MTNVLLITFIITLLYIGIAKRLLTYIKILALQGILLFCLSFINLIEINTVNLIFILLETIVFKTIAVPWFLNYVMKKNKITREAEPYLHNFFSLLIITGIIFLSYILSSAIADGSINKIFFVAALSTLFTGLYIIVTRRKIITQVMGYLVLENGVFILSLAVGSEMPMVVNAGILLDVFVSVLVLGIFVSRIGDTFEEMSVENLQNLKD